MMEREPQNTRCDYTRPGVEPWWEERPCDREFGHPHDHDDQECQWLMDNMSPEPYMDRYGYIGYDYPAYDPQTDHFERFGRPMFPNEY